MSTIVDGIRQVTVVGAGLMGHGIAQEFALAGYQVRLNDTDEARLAHARERIARNLRELHAAGKLDDGQLAGTPERIATTTSLEEAGAGADLVVEAVFEDLALKRAIFATLDRVCPPHAILASNTSSYMPSKLADATARPDKVIVAHYFNPPHLLPLVELVRSEATSDATVETLHAIYTRMGKRPVIAQREAPGFIANRLQMAVLREALEIVARGIATPADVDLVVRSSIGRRWSVAGPFELHELIGTDLALAVASEIMPDLATGSEALEMLREKVARGELGVRSGRGFYEWTPESAEALRQRVATALLAIDDWDSGR